MKRLISLILAISVLTATGCTSVTGTSSTDVTASDTALTADTGYNKYFQADKVIDIKITLPEDEYQDMLNNAKDEEYKSADLTFDSTSIENVGFRTKGNLTLNSVASSDSDRYSFRIKLDKYVDGQTLDGLDEFVINNMYSDASYMREFLSYEALRSIGVDVPQCVFANIYINDELKGLYLCVEAIDESYIDRVFGNTDGNLYKAEMGSSLVYKENDSYESLELKMGSDESKTGLKNMIKTLNSIENGNKGNIEQVLDVDSALKYIAFNYVFCNYDSYLGSNQQNYYLYENNGVFSVIPWDFNMSMGGMGRGERGASLDMPVSSQEQDSFPLVTKLLSVDEYKERYYGYVEALLDYCSEAEDRIAEIKELIYDDVKADPTKFCTLEDFEKATTYSEETDNTDTMPQGDNGTPPQKPEGDNGTPPQRSENDGATPPQRPEDDGSVPPQRPEGDNITPPQRDNGNNPEFTPDQGTTADKSDENNTASAADNSRPTPPQNGGRGHNGMMQNNTSSIVSFVKNQLESISAELASK